MKYFFLVLFFCLVFVSPAFAESFNTLHGDDWFNLAALVVPVASFLANFTKTDKDNKAVGFLSQLVNILALNFKKTGIK